VIDVALTRADLRRADVAVVIDVLRATSTATQALASGYHRVLCAQTIHRARQLSGPGRVLAGEQRCVKPPGFDQGNSPAEAINRRGVEFVLATTNGATTIVAARQRAARVMLACLLNFDAVVRVLQAAHHPEQEVQIVCSGTNGAAALEDVYLAGRLSARLRGERTDPALVAEAVARGFDSPLAALAASADAAVLREAGLTGDIAYCALESELDVVPAVIAAGAGVAAVAELDQLADKDLAGRTIDADDTVSV
jgi:2-phosphosulfolactate phosphatase